MATFTMRLNQVLEVTTNIGLDAYPIFDTEYRAGLNQKIIDHFWNQEIGLETISMFRFAMARKMNEIMPLYNQLYKSTQLQFDPLMTIDIRSVASTTGTAAGTSVNNGTTAETTESDNLSESKASAVASSFPQNRLGGNKDYATSGQDNVSASEAKSVGKGTGTSKQEESNTANQEGTTDGTTTGFQGNRSALLMDYRASFLNVDMLVISELDELFMSVLSTSDSYIGASREYGYYGW